MEYRSPWGEIKKPVRSPGLSKKPKEGREIKRIFWGVVVLLVLILGGGAFYLASPGDEPRVGVSFIQPPRVLVGEPFTLGVSFSNLSESILRNTKVMLFLPDDVAALGKPQSQRVVEEAAGDLGPGSVGRKDFELIVVSGADALKRVTARLQYATDAATGAQFESSADADLLVGGASLGLALASPQSVFSGQDFELKISYVNNSGREFGNVRLRLDYPAFFNFARSSVEPDDAARNSWTLGNVAPGASGNIVITGNVIGLEGSFFNFESSLLADFLGSTYRINSQSAGMAISSSPLSVDITLNNSKDYVAKLSENLTYTLTYRNNSNLIMQDVVLSARLIGEMFNAQTLSTNGVFNSLTNTVSWFGANTPQLLNIGPGQSGSVNFRISAKDAFPIRLLSDKNFTLKIEGRIESRTLPPGTAAERTISVAALENKMAGKTELAAQAFWRDAASGILNQGPYPPKANTPTQYTIHWKIRNHSTDIRDAVVSAFLQSGARFTGQVKSNIDASPLFNPASGLLTWNVGSVAATRGIINDPVEAIFQIELTPSIAQVGQRVALIGETKMEGTDSFTGLRVSGASPALNTDLPHDTTITTGDRRVQP